MDWTKEQKQAIEEKGSNILVAAAAGSGKTAVLVERIIKKVIDDKIDIDKLLVVTFTNAAASEMRERVLDAIYKKLDENPNNENLLRQITLLNKASICTIDSFCLDVVRNNFYELENLSPNFRIADTTEIDLLKQEVIEDLFEKKYEEDGEDFTKLIHTYTSYKDDTPLKDLILRIYNYIQSNPFPQKWLNEKIEMFNIENKLEEDFSKTEWGKSLLKQIEEELEDGITSLKEAKKLLSFNPDLEGYLKIIEHDIDMLNNLNNNLDNWDNAYEINKNIEFVTWNGKRIKVLEKDNAKKIRDVVKKNLEILDDILSCDSKTANQDIFDMYNVLTKLEKIILEFEEEFSKRKRDKNIVDFQDIEHFALKILIKENDGKIENTPVAKKYQEKYEEIAIDEYQDSNLVQEYILNSVSKGNNIFMVGDVKQSIYKFRQAMPELFISKYKNYKNKETKTKDDNLKIQLFKNFRSRENVLYFTNLVFQDIMSENLGDIDYNKEEYLNLGANYPEEKQNLNTEIDIIDLFEEDEAKKEVYIEKDKELEDEERIENVELEARFVANKIKELVEDKFKVWDNKKEEYRNISYKDIVVLLRSTSNIAPVFEQELLDLEIPVFSDSSQEYLDAIEIQTIMSLLKIIDNPMQDIPLVCVLRSYIGKFTDNELVQIRLTDKYDNFYTCMQKATIDVNKELKEKIEDFFRNLDMWRKEQEYLSLDELIWKIYSDTGYYNYVGLMPNGNLRQANLKMLFQKAKDYESSNFKGLYNFINFIDKLKLSSGDMGSAKLIGENDDVVRIMSIHKSKGLEFPVVFLSNTGKQFNLNDLKENVLLHQDMGIGAKYIDYDIQIKYDTLSKQAIENKILLETLSEEMRILYVALTRAKEKLYITGVSKDFNKDLEKINSNIEIYGKENEKINPILVKKYRKYLEWILLVYQYEKNICKDKVNLNIYKKKELLNGFKKVENKDIDVIEELENNAKCTKNEEEIKKITDILNYKYPNIIDTIIPTKTSVTSIKEIENKNMVEITKGKPKEFDENENIEKKITLKKPEFLRNKQDEKITANMIGTLVHLCLQKLDEKVDYNMDKLKSLLEELEAKKIITTKEKEVVDVNKVLGFTKSKIWEELKTAKVIEREKPFYINIPANSVYNKETNENILVQGIIDLYYIDKEDNLKLVDYKTDFVKSGDEEELIKKYKSQLDLYKKALEEVYKKEVSNTYIYSVYLNKELEIK